MVTISELVAVAAGIMGLTIVLSVTLMIESELAFRLDNRKKELYLTIVMASLMIVHTDVVGLGSLLDNHRVALVSAAAMLGTVRQIVGTTATLIVVLVVHPACHTEACTVVQSCLEDRQRPEGASAPSPQMAPQSCISG